MITDPALYLWRLHLTPKINPYIHRERKKANWTNVIGRFLKPATDFLYIMCNFSVKEKKIPLQHFFVYYIYWGGWGQGETGKKKCHYRKCWLIERDKAT